MFALRTSPSIGRILRHVDAPAPPRLFDVALPWIAFAPASLPSPYGIIGIDPASAVALPPLFVQQPAGIGSVSIAIPSAPVFTGLSLYSQVGLIQFGWQAHLTNVATGVVQ